MEYIYATLLLHKLGKPIDEEGIKKIIEATGTPVDEAKVKTLVTSLKDIDIEKAISETSIQLTSSGGGEGKKEEKEGKEEKKEAAAEGLSALFG